MKPSILSRLAEFLAKPAVRDLLLRLAKRRPYDPIVSPDGTELYMWRGWLFNRYDRGVKLEDGRYSRGPLLPFLPSIRLHRIMRPDDDRHLHDHPWDARTFILDGWYVEEREQGAAKVHIAGETSSLRFGEYHRIHAVSPGGVLTLFVTFRHRGVWGFKVAGRKVPWREYLGQR